MRESLSIALTVFDIFLSVEEYLRPNGTLGVTRYSDFNKNVMSRSKVLINLLTLEKQLIAYP